MAKIILNVPDNEFGVDIQNKFQDFFGRVKVEIDNRVKVGDTLLCGAYEIETAEMFLNAFKEMKIIPDNATNGDMIKAMFPYGKYGTNGNEVHVYGVGGNGCLVFTLDWWNAPYKRGSENGSN